MTSAWSNLDDQCLEPLMSINRGSSSLSFMVITHLPASKVA